MSTKHTPGPWEVDDDNEGTVCVMMGSALKSPVRYRSNHRIVVGEELEDGPQLDEAFANARLIAAAPDHALLLSAISCGMARLFILNETVVVRVWKKPDDPPWSGKNFDTPLDELGCPILSDECRAAVREAKGEET